MNAVKAFPGELHPRGRDGKFIQAGHEVRLPGGGTGRVAVVHRGTAVVDAEDGTHRAVPAGQLEHVTERKPPLSDAEYQEHTARVEQKLREAVAAGMATDRVHTLDVRGEIWSPDRAAVHKDIVQGILAKAAHVPNDGKMVIAGGLGGAGKTTVLKGHAGVDPGRYLTLNPDDVKEEMARRGMIPHVEGLSPMEASPLVHEEASHITSMAARQALRERRNLLWDITMSSHRSASKRIDDARAHGYSHVRGVFVDIPAESSVQRAMARHRRGMEKHRNGEGHGGRYVPPALIRKAAGTGQKSANRQAFESLRPRFDRWDVYDNSVHGRAPVRLASSHEKMESR